MVKKLNNIINSQLDCEKPYDRSAISLSEKAIISIQKKSEKSDIPFYILKEVYNRGYKIWNEDFGGTREQFAFDRVNSFISGGFAADLDGDLMEKRGLWDNIWAKRRRIAKGSGEKMRKPGSKGAPTKEALKRSQNEEYISEGKPKTVDPNASYNPRSMHQALSSLGWEQKTSGGSGHAKYIHPTSDKTLIVPLNHPGEINRMLSRKIIKTALSAKPPEISEALDKKVLTTKQIANKFNKSEKSIENQLAKGKKVEHEHTSSDTTAEKIASAHLGERPDYYKKLSKLEKQKITEKVMTEPHSKNKNKSASRFDASKELVTIYSNDTPGQKKRVLETIKQIVRDKLEEAKSPAWQRKEGKDPSGGLNKKGVASYRAQNPGSKLQTAVTTEPSKLKPGSKKAKRRLSFCRRMKGMKKKLTSAKTARDPDSRINKSLRKWNC